MLERCIYRGTTLIDTDPEDDNFASIEHIIPFAVGGSDGLVTSDASKFANNDLGSKVDAPFANTLPIAIKRHQLQLKSQGGNIPPIVWRGESPEGIRGKMTINPDGTVKVDFDLKVDRLSPGEQGRFTVAGPEGRIEPVLKGLLEGMKKRKQKVYSKDGALLASLDDFLGASDQILLNQLNMKIEYFNQESWTRGILKIVLSIGHKILGREWTFGQTGELIRKYVLNPRESWPAEQPRGYIAGEWDRSLRLALGKTAAVRDELQHTIGILPYEPSGNAAALISLFGGNGVPEAVVMIGRIPPAILQALKQSNYDVILGYRVNPRTRKASPIRFGDIERQIAKYGPTSRKALGGFYQNLNLR